MSSEKLNLAINAIKLGNKSAAMKILADIVMIDQKNEIAWFWLSRCVDETERKIYCLSKVLAINPNNQDARQELNQLEQAARPSPSKTLSSAPPNSAPLPDNKVSATQKQSSIKWVVIIAAGVFVGLCLCVFAFIAVPLLKPKTTYTVGYDAIGGGVITYRNEYGNTAQTSGSTTSNWSKTFQATSGNYLYVSIQADRVPFASCMISVNDYVQSESRATVAYGIATCSYRLP